MTKLDTLALSLYNLCLTLLNLNPIKSKNVTPQRRNSKIHSISSRLPNHTFIFKSSRLAQKQIFNFPQTKVYLSGFVFGFAKEQILTRKEVFVGAVSFFPIGTIGSRRKTFRCSEKHCGKPLKVGF